MNHGTRMLFKMEVTGGTDPMTYMMKRHTFINEFIEDGDDDEPIYFKEYSKEEMHGKTRHSKRCSSCTSLKSVTTDTDIRPEENLGLKLHFEHLEGY